MMLGYAPFCAIPFSAVLTADDHSVPDPISSLIAGDGRDLRYLVEIHAYDNGIMNSMTMVPPPFGAAPFGCHSVTTWGGVSIERFADHVFITEPNDDPPNTPYAACVENALTFDSSIISGNQLGVKTVNFGAIDIVNASGDQDGLVRKIISGRRVVVKAGYDGFTYDKYATVFDGLASGIEHTDTDLTITITDKAQLLDREIIVPTYQGGGGLDGGKDVAGTIKPICFGVCFNVEPVLVDAANLVYQVHAWSMQAVDSVYDSGVPLSTDGDRADIYAVKPAAGHYSTCLSRGLVRLGSTPSGRVTINAKGDNQGGYSASLSQICKRAATMLYGSASLSPDEIDTQGFADIDRQIAGSFGLYVRDKTTVREILDDLLNECGAYWFFNRVGLLSAAAVSVNGYPTIKIGADDIDSGGLELTGTIKPSWKTTVGYAPVWTKQNESEMAGSASDTQRTFVGNEYRLLSVENRRIRTANAQTIERTFYTKASDEATARSILSRLSAVYGAARNVYKGTFYGIQFKAKVGDKVDLSYDRYGVGGEMIVVSVGEDARTGQTTLELVA